MNLVLLVDGATVASMQHREQGIFEAVGLPYVAPEFRDCPS